MTRPIVFGTSVCGLLLAGLIARPTIWSGGNSPAVSSPAQTSPILTPDAPEQSSLDIAIRPLPQVDYGAFSQVELRQEANTLWRRAVMIQDELHREPTGDEREVLLAQLEKVVERSNEVQALQEQ